MTWTKTKPTKPGYYWYRERPEDEPEIRRIDPDGVVRLMGDNFCQWVWKPYWMDDEGWNIQQGMARIHGEWAGPVRPPA